MNESLHTLNSKSCKWSARRDLPVGWIRLFLALLIGGSAFSGRSLAQSSGVGNKQSADTTLTEAETVPLLYNVKVPAALNIASAQSVSGKQLYSMPGNLLKSTLAGRLTGLNISQSDGQPGIDAYSISLRGQSPLVVIDGIPQNFTFSNFNEIETVTVLKDALATAMYGPQASNGVLLITTRKGEPGSQRISVTAQSNIQKPLKWAKPLDAYNYALLYNEALANDNRSPVFTQEDLDAYRNHSDPYGHPDVNWLDQAFRKSSRLDQISVDLSGGSKIARYFVTGEYLNQGGIFNTNSENTYNTNSSFDSYSIRSNVDVTLDPRTVVGLNIAGRVFQSNEPGTSSNSVIGDIFTTPNNAYPVFNENGSLAGNQQFQKNIYGQLNRSGYRINYERNMLADLFLRRSLDNILKGLWVKGVVAFSAALSQDILRNKNFATYQAGAGGAGDVKFSEDNSQSNNASVDRQWRQGYAEFDLGYNGQFGKNGVDAMVLYSRNGNRVNSDLPLIYQGLSGRVAYNYDEKYLAEFAFGYNGANRYPEGFRYRFFPAAGLGWNINREKFLQDVRWISHLKLFGSYGKTGNNRNGYYSFQQYFFDGDKVFFGTTPSSFTTMDELVLANPDLDYEKAKKLNAGIEGSFFSNRLSFKVEYYRNKFYDLIRTRGKSSSIIGNSYPSENIGTSRHYGWEMNLGWNQKSGGFSYFISNNVSIARSKNLYIDEVYQPYDWMKRTGRPVGQAFGYRAVGLFTGSEDLEKGAVVDGYTPKPGDILYEDLNGDGVISQFDEAPIGNTRPLIFFGSTLGVSFKGFDLSALIQGAVNRNVVLTGASEWEFQNGGFGQAYEHHLNRWVPGAETASYPRLTVGSNANNQIAASSFWYHNGNYARLKFAELGYTFGTSGWIRKIHLQSLRVFINSTNLFTISAYDRVDPEVYGNNYPLQRTISGGLTINL